MFFGVGVGALLMPPQASVISKSPSTNTGNKPLEPVARNAPPVAVCDGCGDSWGKALPVPMWDIFKHCLVPLAVTQEPVVLVRSAL